jgi:hypothetical protein
LCGKDAKNEDTRISVCGLGESRISSENECEV